MSLASPRTSAPVAAPPAARVAPRWCSPAPVCLPRLLVLRPIGHYHDNGYNGCKSYACISVQGYVRYYCAGCPMPDTVITTTFISIPADEIVLQSSLLIFLYNKAPKSNTGVTVVLQRSALECSHEFYVTFDGINRVAVVMNHGITTTWNSGNNVLTSQITVQS